MKRLLLAAALVLRLGWSHAQGFLPPPVDLPIANIPQETSVWCWVAVAQQIVAASHGMSATPPQCELVETAYGAAPGTCCGGYNPACERPGSFAQIQGLIREFGGRMSHYSPPASPMALYQTLSAGRAVILQLRMSAGPGISHVVVVRGMSWIATPYGPRALLHVNDPMSIYTMPVPFDVIAPMWAAAIVVH